MAYKTLSTVFSVY